VGLKPNAEAQVFAPPQFYIEILTQRHCIIISVFLSLPCTFEVYLRRWSFLVGCLEQDEAHFIDICQIRGG